ncbi:MAG: TolC family protein [Calditrichia bacterium]
MFPFPGKLGLKEQIAAENARVSQAQLQETRNQLVNDLKSIYFNLFFVDKAIETTLKNTSLVQSFVQIAQTKYAVGKGLQQDVLKAQVELSKMEDKLIGLRQKRAALEARLNALLNRPADAPVGKTPELEPGNFSFNLAELKELADQNRPLFAAWQAMERQSMQKVKLAKKEYLPDFKITAAYTQRDVLQNGMGGADFVSGLFSMNIPLYFWKKQRKNVEENRYLQSAVQRNFQNIRNQVYAALEETLSEVEKNQRLSDLYRNGIIPQATQSLHSAISGYQTDKVDFLTLLSNQITLFNYQLDYYRILSDYYTGIAKLELLTGKRFAEE